MRSAGAIIKEDESGFYIDGSELRDAEIKIIPDTIEVGTYLYLAPLTCGDFSMDKSLSKELEVPLNCLRSGGIKISEEGDALKINGEITKSLCVETMPYPGYPTDLQPQIAPLMAKYCGGKIIENVWLGRFGYLRALEAFGVKYKQVDNSAVIYNSELKNGNTNAPDLRGGIACVMCALAAKGNSEVYSAEVIMRGYSSLVDKLRSLGADIRIE